MTAFYNEHDRFAAAWLRELIADGLIAPGIVDERSIEDITPSELVGFRQCHWFAGIGVWSLALRRVGWSDDRTIWTASCPCQPFSAAGKGGGFADERHLWPALYWLIRQCRPAIIVGEQVSSDDGLAWFDALRDDMDHAGYACGALDTCASGFGSPHIRQRLYWMGVATSGGCEWFGLESAHRVIVSTSKDSSGAADAGRECSAGRGDDRDMGSAQSGDDETRRERERIRTTADDGRADGRMADADATGPGIDRRELSENADAQSGTHAHGRGATDRPGPTNGLWRDVDWLGCRDGKWRPVRPGSFPLAATGTVRNRVGMLRCAGNALNLAQAEGFVRAVMDTQ